MSCESNDLKDYYFGEAEPGARQRVESHLETCGACRDELSRLQLTHAALGALRDEEIPRRIAFVSDKVFSPRWYQRLWHSGPQLGFLSASMLACAILVHAFAGPRPVAPPASIVTAAVVDQAAIEREVGKRIDLAVTRAVAHSEQRQQKKTVELLQAADRKYELDRQSTLQAVTASADYMKRALNRDYALNNFGSGQ